MNHPVPAPKVEKVPMPVPEPKQGVGEKKPLGFLPSSEKE
jgi:hypothetical protein